MDAAHAPGAGPGNLRRPLWFDRPLRPTPAAYQLPPTNPQRLAMSLRDRRTPIWFIWGLVIAFAVVEVAAWTVAGGVPRRPLVLVQVIGAWIVVLILAVLATRRIGSMAGRIREQEHTHRASLAEIEQLQTQNAMLEIIAKSVDVPLAFQALATRIVRIVPCDRVGLALLNEAGDEFQTFTARVQEEERRARPRPGRDVPGRTDGTRQRGAIARADDRPRHLGNRRRFPGRQRASYARASAR